MKYLLILIALSFSLQAASIEAFADKMHYETNYEKAMEKAKKEKKLVMLVMVTHYCPWCRKYERDTLSKKSISKLVKEKYIPLVLNREDRKFPKKFDTERIPITMFIDPKSETLIYKEMGYKIKKEFLDMEAKVKP
jgi:thioredoxin-related protein